jgi:hypothetical protein
MQGHLGQGPTTSPPPETNDVSSPSAHQPLRYVFYGRTARADAQSSPSAISRQLASCAQSAASIDGKITAHYWEIENGCTRLQLRGKDDHGPLLITAPRAGGINDLLRDAANGHFDAVIVNNIDRFSRIAADAAHVEQELERLGVRLVVADEPIAAAPHSPPAPRSASNLRLVLRAAASLGRETDEERRT